MTDILDQTIASKAEEWSTEDIETIIAAQREYWKAFQAKPPRTRAKAGATARKPTISQKASQLKGIKL